MKDVGRVGMLAFALRTPMRVWWHVEKNQMKLAFRDVAHELHFKSFAEMGVCGCAARPDSMGLVSNAVKDMLRRINTDKPIHIDFSEKRKGSKVRWGKMKILE